MTSRLDELFDGLPKRLGVQEVAELLDVTTQGVYKWIHSGTIPAYKLGATWIILRDELRDAIASGSNLTRRLTVDEAGEPSPEQDTD
ncbi:MAG: helix-turn-helix domain-containing protein [Dermatophilaceae bacterium]